MPKRLVIGSPRRCIFCGNGPVTKEHIWSEWTYKILPKRQGGSHTADVFLTSHGSTNITGLHKTRFHHGEVNARRVRAVCRTCNNGWMGSLEEQTIPVLTPLILCTPIWLDETEQTVLSRWLAMKTAVTEHANPEFAAISQAERDFIRYNPSPPNTGWQIWIGMQSGERWRTGACRLAHTLGSRMLPNGPIEPPNGDFSKNTQTQLFGFGFVFAYIFATRVPNLRFEPPAAAAPYLRQVWPFERPVDWPGLAAPLPDDAIDALAMTAQRAASALPWKSTFGSR